MPLYSLNFTFCPEIQLEDSAFVDLTTNIDISTHMLDYLFANGQPKAGPLLIPLGVLCQFSKINEKVLQALLGDSYASILYVNSELYIIFASSDITFWNIFGHFPKIEVTIG